MYIASNIKCADCGDIIRLAWNSREKGFDMQRDSKTCSCEKLKAYRYGPGIYDISISNSGNTSFLSAKEQDIETEWYPEDSIGLDNEDNNNILEIANCMIKLKNDCIIDAYDINMDGDTMDIYFEKTDRRNQTTNISIHEQIREGKGWNNDARKIQHARIKQALKNMRMFLQKIENDEIDLTDASSVWEDESLNGLWYEGSRHQLKLYDYKYRC